MNTLLDPENGVLEYSFLDPETAEDRVTRIDYRRCTRTELQPLIAHVLAAEAKQRADRCASMRETLASGPTHARGRPINGEAGGRMLEEEC